MYIIAVIHTLPLLINNLHSTHLHTKIERRKICDALHHQALITHSFISVGGEKQVDEWKNQL